MKTFAIVDDHEILRNGVVTLFEGNNEFQCIISAGSGKALLHEIETLGVIPDVCIVDIKMPGWDGFKTLEELKAKYGNRTEVLIFSLFVTDLNVHRAIKLGAKGIVDKSCPPDVFTQALIALTNHQLFIHTNRIFETSDVNNLNLTQPLSTNEITFLNYCLTELTYKEIAEEMNGSIRTIETYRDRLFDKLKVKTRAGLAVYAVASGLS